MKKTYIIPALSVAKACASDIIATSLSTNSGENSQDKGGNPMGGSGALVRDQWQNDIWSDDSDLW